jgi:hypothetical protein
MMTMSNPLLDKFDELYGSPKKETTEETKEDIGRQKLKEVVTRAMRSGYVTHDLDSLRQSFLDVAGKVVKNEVKVISSEINFDADAMGTISFTVML